MVKSGDEPDSASGELILEVKEIDNALHNAPEIFIDGAQGLAVSETLVKINFYQDRMLSVMSGEDEDTIRRTVCLRMVLTHRSLVELYQWLTPAVERLKKLHSSAPEEEVHGAKSGQ